MRLAMRQPTRIRHLTAVPNTVLTLLVLLGTLAQSVHSQTCTANGNCEVIAGSNDVACTCYGYGSTVNNCDTITCPDGGSCLSHTFSNSDKVECTGSASCMDATFSNVVSVDCAAGEACRNTIISNVPAGGQIDCFAGAFGHTCSEATISSTSPFTLTCHGSPFDCDTNAWGNPSCSSGLITNPKGSVFCQGGSNDGAICQDLPIRNTVGCLICGNDNACHNVTIVKADGTIGKTISDKVWVKPSCTETQVLDYLNAMHPEGGQDCQDSDNSGYCDVVEKFCARSAQSNDHNCVEEFKLETGAQWTKVTISSVSAVDPSTIPSKMTSAGHDVDKAGPKHWVAGFVAIAFFSVAVVMVVFFRMHKTADENDGPCSAEVKEVIPPLDKTQSASSNPVENV